MSYAGDVTLMGEEAVCPHCCRGIVVVPMKCFVLGPVQVWRLQNMQAMTVHMCDGKAAAWAAERLAELRWRQEHAKKIRRRV